MDITDVRFKCPITSVIQSTVLVNKTLTAVTSYMGFT